MYSVTTPFQGIINLRRAYAPGLLDTAPRALLRVSRRDERVDRSMETQDVSPS